MLGEFRNCQFRGAYFLRIQLKGIRLRLFTQMCALKILKIRDTRQEQI